MRPEHFPKRIKPIQSEPWRAYECEWIALTHWSRWPNTKFSVHAQWQSTFRIFHCLLLSYDWRTVSASSSLFASAAAFLLFFSLFIPKSSLSSNRTILNHKLTTINFMDCLFADACACARHCRTSFTCSADIRSKCDSVKRRTEFFFSSHELAFMQPVRFSLLLLLCFCQQIILNLIVIPSFLTLFRILCILLPNENSERKSEAFFSAAC